MRGASSLEKSFAFRKGAGALGNNLALMSAKVSALKANNLKFSDPNKCGDALTW